MFIFQERTTVIRRCDFNRIVDGVNRRSDSEWASPCVLANNSDQRKLTAGGKYHCTAALQFNKSGFNYFTTYKEQHIFFFGQIQSYILFFYKMGYSWHLFSLFLSFQNSWQQTMFNINFADDGIRTTVLYCRKRPLCQLSHTTDQVLLILRPAVKWSFPNDRNSSVKLTTNF